MNENEEVINILLAQVSVPLLFCKIFKKKTKKNIYLRYKHLMHLHPVK